jgi:hypothetical protein
MRSTLERSHIPLERLARRILSARVLVALVTANTLLCVRGGQVHGRHDRARQRVGTLTGMHRAGAEGQSKIVFKYAGHRPEW